jgi:25S rRNA (adenine(2142)-N(1))-methyltransferase, Bmt2
MPKGSRRRKLPVTVAGIYGSSSTPRTSRTVIRKFHTLLKQQKSAQGDTLTSINHELEKLGGLEKYQHMSCIGQGTDRGGGSEKVLIGWLKKMGWGDQKHRYVRVVYTGSSTVLISLLLDWTGPLHSDYSMLARSNQIIIILVHLGST